VRLKAKWHRSDDFDEMVTSVNAALTSPLRVNHQNRCQFRAELSGWLIDTLSALLFIDRLRVWDEDDKVYGGRPRRRGDTLGVKAHQFQDAPCSILKRRDSGNRPS